MKKKLGLHILLLITLLVVSACEEEKVPVFSATQGINFVATDGPNDGKDTSTLLDRSIDMVPYYAKGNFAFEYDTLNVLIRIEGTVSDKPLKVSCKALPLEGYAMPEFIIPETSIEPGTLIDTIRIYTKHLTYLDSLYKAKIVFDYEKSEVIPGVKERQQFILSVSDIFPLKDKMYAANGKEWNKMYSYLLGEYGEQKIRLIWSVLKGKNTIFYYFYYYDDDSDIKKKIPQFKAALDNYNKAHKDSPLKEKDGKLVTFDIN